MKNFVILLYLAFGLTTMVEGVEKKNTRKNRSAKPKLQHSSLIK